MTARIYSLADAMAERARDYRLAAIHMLKKGPKK